MDWAQAIAQGGAGAITVLMYVGWLLLSGKLVVGRHYDETRADKERQSAQIDRAQDNLALLIDKVDKILVAIEGRERGARS